MKAYALALALCAWVSSAGCGASQKPADEQNASDKRYHHLNAEEQERINKQLERFWTDFNRYVTSVRIANPTLHTADDIVSGTKLNLPYQNSKPNEPLKRAVVVSKSEEVDYVVCEEVKALLDSLDVQFRTDLVLKEYKRDSNGNWNLTFMPAIDCADYLGSNPPPMHAFPKKK